MHFVVFLAIFINISWKINAEGNNCLVVNENLGNITDVTKVPYDSTHVQCWTILVPPEKLLLLTFSDFNLDERDCDDVFLEVSVQGFSKNYMFCAHDSIPKPITALNDVNITYHVRSNKRDVYGFLIKYEGSIDINYHIEDLLCSLKNSFRCSSHRCIPKEKVCDGNKDCENGADEIGCETGIFSVEGVDQTRESAINLLKSKRSAFAWGKDTARAAITLRLAGEAGFNGTQLEEEFIAKHVELDTTVDLLKNWSKPLHPYELSNLINALVATCYNPRRFHGFNLVQILKNLVGDATSSVNPIAFLAICNANEPSPENFGEKLLKILKENSNNPFKPNIQAVAVMAISCMLNRKESFEDPGKATLAEYNATIKKFKTLQQRDGSFGNMDTTSLITQALLASGEEHSKDWKSSSAVRYLMKPLNSPVLNILSAYLAIPIFNGKTLADLSKTDCSGYIRNQNSDNAISEYEEYMGAKINVFYSLFLGDDMQIIHSIRMKIPAYISAYDVMKIAAKTNPKYRFESKRISNKIYVYEIAGLANDAEKGKFWQLHLAKGNNDYTGSSLTESPDEVSLDDNDHLIMRYETIHA